MSEYGWSIRYALDVPLMQAFALYTAITLRHGGKLAGPGYRDRAILAALRQAARASTD